MKLLLIRTRLDQYYFDSKRLKFVCNRFTQTLDSKFGATICGDHGKCYMSVNRTNIDNNSTPILRSPHDGKHILGYSYDSKEIRFKLCFYIIQCKVFKRSEETISCII